MRKLRTLVCACADMVGMRLSALRSLFVRWGSESVWCVVVGKARTHGRRENAILYPPPRSAGGGPQAVRARLVCSVLGAGARFRWGRGGAGGCCVCVCGGWLGVFWFVVVGFFFFG